jgi:bifunctional DNase/RNase
MGLIQLQIKGISYSQSRNGSYALVLNEVSGIRTLPIIIGPFEAQAIAIALEENIKPPRPLTHDLFNAFADIYHFTVKKVIIHKLIDGVFYSSLIVEKDKIEEIIDSRTSDAIAIALRFNAPIYTYENIMDKASFEMLDDELLPEESMEGEEVDFVEKLFSELEKSTKNTSNMSLEDLQKQMNEAIANEDYELAARLRDEITKREKLE